MAQADVQIICKKGGLRKLLAKVFWLQAYSAGSGIWAREGKRKVQRSNTRKNWKALKKKGQSPSPKAKSSITLAYLANLLDGFSMWIQPKTVAIPTDNGQGHVVLVEGHRYRRPMRPFIMLWKVTEVWETLRSKVRALVLAYLNNIEVKGTKGNSKKFLNIIAQSVEQLQKDRILEHRLISNGAGTQAIKGFDWPHYHTGNLVNSIRGDAKATTSNLNGKQIIADLDNLLKSLEKGELSRAAHKQLGVSPKMSFKWRFK